MLQIWFYPLPPLLSSAHGFVQSILDLTWIPGLGLIGLMCIRGRRRQTTKPTDDKDERNLIALSLIIHLWITLISKPTAENPTVEEVGGASSAEGGHPTEISGKNGFISPFDGKFVPVLSFRVCKFRGSSLWRDNEISRCSQGTVMAEGTTQAHPGQMKTFLHSDSIS